MSKAPIAVLECLGSSCPKPAKVRISDLVVSVSAAASNLPDPARCDERKVKMSLVSHAIGWIPVAGNLIKRLGVYYAYLRTLLASGAAPSKDSSFSCDDRGHRYGSRVPVEDLGPMCALFRSSNVFSQGEDAQLPCYA